MQIEKKLPIFLVCLLLLFGCNTPHSPISEVPPDSPICVLQSKANHRLLEHMQVLVDTISGYSIEDITRPERHDRFVPFPEKTFKPQGHQVYWGKIQLENRLPDAEMHLEWVLNLSETFTQVALYRQSEDSTWVSEANGSFVPEREKNFVPTKFGTWFKVPLPPGKVVTLYFRGESERVVMPPTFHAFVQPIDVFYDKLVSAKQWSTLFAGFLLMMLFYNLLNYFFVRDRSYIYYTGYLLMVLVYTSYSSDDIEDWLGSFIFIEHPAYFSLFKISIYLGLMCYLAFIRSFLDLEHLLPRWDRYFRYLTWLGVPIIVLFFYLAFRYQFSYVIDDRPILLYIGLVSLSSIFLVYPLFKTKDPKGFFITAGIAVISFGFLLTLHSRMTQTPFTVFYLKLGTILEVLIFSMGLAYRQRQQEKAKQQADFALKESQLLQEKNQLEANRLQELNEFKSRFFTNITHEFRTPLTVILGMASLPQAPSERGGGETPPSLSEGAWVGPLPPPSEGAGGRLLIKRNAENLLRLVNQILDLAKLESNSLKINYIQGDVLAYLKYITESLHSLANAQNVMLRVESDQKSIVMDHDPERLLQIVHNLLSNAIKFTPSGGKVVMRVTTSAGFEPQPTLTISVADTGAGIPADELPHLFERFFQAKNQEHVSPSPSGRAGVGSGGTGIGLSLAAELVKAMGGEISVESTVGMGSTFFVTLPVTNNSAFEEKGANRGLDDGKAGLENPKIRTAAEPQNDDTALPHILLIEDNPDVVEYLVACLQGKFALDFAYNGEAGIEKAFENVPDLIVSDVMMPIKDGFEVVETLKNDARASHIPIVLLTAKVDVQSRLSGLRRGADAYLSKPFHQEELLVTLENLLESRRKLQLKYQQNALATAAPDVPAADLEDAFLQKFRAVVERNLSDPNFEMPQLERALGMSRSQIFRKTKALTGKSPSLFIRSIRLNEGRRLLQTTTLTVSEIAYEVGYLALNNFSDAFMEEFGERPMKVRG